MYIGYYVPKFPISYITQDGMDGWINIPSHPRHQYGFLDAILEHIDNTRHIDPICVTIHSIREVNAGPAGVARLYALTHKRNYTHIPSIVSTHKYYDWFGEGVEEIKSAEDIRKHLLLEPASYGIDSDGKCNWQNQNPNEKQLRETFKVSPQTLERFINCI